MKKSLDAYTYTITSLVFLFVFLCVLCCILEENDIRTKENEELKDYKERMIKDHLGRTSILEVYHKIHEISCAKGVVGIELLPASFQEEMILYYEKSSEDVSSGIIIRDAETTHDPKKRIIRTVDIHNVPSSIFIKAAETAHDPNKGFIQGLDRFEIETIRLVDPLRACNYDSMIESSINKENLRVDNLAVIDNFINAIKAYIKARKRGSWYRRFFMSENTINMRELEERSAKKNFLEAEKLYFLQKGNVVSYRTIQQWDFKECKPR